MTDLKRFRSFALSLADAGNELAEDAWRGKLEVTYKEDGSSLTQADLSIETLWRERISHSFPDHSILGEEFGAETGASAYTWVLDPIDGTRQFATGLLNFATLISLCQDDTPVLGIIDLPLAGLRYVAVKDHGVTFADRPIHTSGQSDLDQAVISLANPKSFVQSKQGFKRLAKHGQTIVYDGGSPAYGSLARGLIDVCLNGDDLNPHDICALVPVVTEAGGVITDWQGAPLGLNSYGAIVATASDTLHQKVLTKLNK